MEGKGEAQENEQGMAEVLTVVKALLPDGKAGEQQEDENSARMNGQLTIGERQDVPGRQECQVRPGQYEHERLLVLAAFGRFINRAAVIAGKPAPTGA
jgi:hypothetical protein